MRGVISFLSFAVSEGMSQFERIFEDYIDVVQLTHPRSAAEKGKSYHIILYYIMSYQTMEDVRKALISGLWIVIKIKCIF